MATHKRLFFNVYDVDKQPSNNPTFTQVQDYTHLQYSVNSANTLDHHLKQPRPYAAENTVILRSMPFAAWPPVSRNPTDPEYCISSTQLSLFVTSQCQNPTSHSPSSFLAYPTFSHDTERWLRSLVTHHFHHVIPFHPPTHHQATRGCTQNTPIYNHKQWEDRFTTEPSAPTCPAVAHTCTPFPKIHHTDTMSSLSMTFTYRPISKSFFKPT